MTPEILVRISACVLLLFGVPPPLSECTYISGSFCVSMMAAMGMPKLEAGPQKSDCEIS